MSQTTRTELMPGVFLTTDHVSKFKTCHLSVTLITALEREHAALNALVPVVLRRGSERHPDLRTLSCALDDLYGGTVEASISKKGEIQCVGLTATFLDDAFVPSGEAILPAAAGLLGELLLHPRTENGVFCAEYVRSEQKNLIDRIRAQMNDKRVYCVMRLGQEMCRDEAFGVGAQGDEESAATITPDSLWRQYQTLLRDARVELYYSGSAAPEQVAEAMKRAFADLPVDPARRHPVTQVHPDAPEHPRTVIEHMEVTQGKLALGFRTGGIRCGDEGYPAMLLMNAIFGGTSMSKLFMNVREKLSLCYFASSTMEKWKGLLLVSSGIEFDKYEQAKNEILAQLDACRRGEITDDELVGARRIIVTAFRTMLDSQRRTADYWLSQTAAGLFTPPEETVRRIEAVTLDEIVAAANAVKLDTVYFLAGKEGV